MMLPHKLKQKICRRLCRKDRGIHAQVASLEPEGAPRGSVLLSFIIEPFLRKSGEPISHDHTHDWESFQMARTFLERGYSVDVISYRNSHFRPQKEYDIFISARTNLEHIAARLNHDCLKVAHLDTAHWLFNNQAAYTRLLELQRRRGVAMVNPKMVEPNRAIEVADLGTVLGNRFTMETYAYAGKPLHRIPISAPLTYPWDDAKEFDRCRNRYLWFGSAGLVHKGLDLVLEAFAGMPENHLTVCGPIEEEAAFVEAYRKELYATPNIRTLGWIDVGDRRFLELARDTVGLVYPSCAEGGGGSAITCMHAGIIPILSREASVDVGESGILLSDNTVPAIREAVRAVSGLSADRLRQMARQAWELARARHTRERFAERFDAFAATILAERE